MPSAPTRSLRRVLGVGLVLALLAVIGPAHAQDPPLTTLSTPESQTFTPDNDGAEDAVQTGWLLGEPATVVWRITDPAGAEVTTGRATTTQVPNAGHAATFRWDGGGRGAGAYGLRWTATGAASGTTAEGGATLEIVTTPSPTAIFVSPDAGTALGADTPVVLRMSGKGCPAVETDPQRCGAVGGALSSTDGRPLGGNSRPDPSTFLDVTVAAQPGNVPDGSVSAVGAVMWFDSYRYLHQARTAPRQFTVSSTASVKITTGREYVYPNAPPSWWDAVTALVGVRLGKAGDVAVDVLSGSSVVSSLPTKNMPAGDQIVAWNGRGTDSKPLPEGAYTLRVTSSGQSDTVEVAVAHTVPSVTVTPADGASVTGPVDVVATATGLSLKSLQLNASDSSGANTGLVYSQSEQPVTELRGTADPTSRLNGASNVGVYVFLVDPYGREVAGPPLDRTWQVTGRNWVTGDTAPTNLGGDVTVVNTTWTASRSGTARLTVRTPAGQIVRQLDNGTGIPVGADLPQMTSWDGRDDAGRSVPDGTYSLQVRAVADGSGLVGELGREIVVSGAVGVAISTPPDGAPVSGVQTVLIQAPPGYAMTSAYLFQEIDANNAMLVGEPTGIGDVGQRFTSLELSFDTARVTPGMHRYFVRAVVYRDGSDTGTSVSTPAVTWTVVAPAVVSMDGSDVTLRPGGDPADDRATVSYTVTRDASVTAVLENAGGTVVATLLDNAATSGSAPQQLVLDGTDSAGAALPNGRYLLRVTAAGGQPATRSVVVDRTVLAAPVLGTADNRTQPVTWSPPEGTDPSTIGNVVLRADGEYLTTMYQGWPDPGTWTASVNPDALGDGTHALTVSVSLDGPLGSTEYVSPAAELVVANGLTVTGQYPPTGPFDPEDPQRPEWTMQVSTSQPASVTWTITRSGQAVRSGTASVSWSYGGRLTWDGKDAAGRPVDDGSYDLAFTASPVKEPTKTVAGRPVAIVVDRTRPGVLTTPAAGAPVADGDRLVFTPGPGAKAVQYVTAYARGRQDVGSWALTRQDDGTWTGRADWSALPDGAYTVDVSVSWTDATDTQRWTGVAGPAVTLRHDRLLTTAPLQSSGVVLATDPDTDNGTGNLFQDSVQLAREATVTVEVLSGETVVATPRPTAAAPAGWLRIEWDASGADGALPGGAYLLRITATDAGGTDVRTVAVDVLADPPATLSGVPVGDAKGLLTLTAGGAPGVQMRGGTLVLYAGGTYAGMFQGKQGSTTVTFPLATSDVDNGSYEMRPSVSWSDRFGGYHTTQLGSLPLSIDNGLRFTGVPAPRTIVPGAGGSEGTYSGELRLTENAPVTVTVLDAAGATVRTLDIRAGRYFGGFSWDGTDGSDGAPPVPDGTYVIRMVATDPYKGTTATEQVEVRVARGKPGFVVGPRPGEQMTGLMQVGFENTLSGPVKSVDGVQFSASRMRPIDLKRSDLFADWMDGIDTRDLVNGGDRVQFVVQWTDTAGSPHVYQEWVDVVPNNDPRLTLTSASGTFSPQGNGVTESFPLSFTSDACTPVRLVVTDGAGAAVRTMPDSVACRGSSTLVWDGRDDAGAPVPAGDYTVTLRSGDTALSRTATVQTDPVLSWALADGATVSDVLPLTLTETAAGGGRVTEVEVGIPGRTTLTPLVRSQGGWTGNLDLPATITGDQTIEIRASWTDAQDRPHAARLTRAVRTDEVNLTLRTDDLGTSGEAPFGYELQIDASALNGPVRWTVTPGVDGVAPLTGTGTSPLSQPVPVTFDAPGSYDVLVEVFDADGRRRHLTQKVEVRPPANRRPTLELGPPSEVKGVASSDKPFAVTIGVRAADPDGTVRRLIVDWGDGAPQEFSGAPTSISHSYTAGGGYTVHVTAEDDALATAGAAVQLTVDDDGPLTARTSSGKGTTVTVDGADVVFDASGSQPAAAVASYAWTFSDGSTATGARVVHAFATPGQHSGTVTITRADGGQPASSTSTQSVQVLDKSTASVSTVAVTGGSGASVAYVDADGGVQTVPTSGEGTAVLYGLPEGTSTVSAFAEGFRATDGTVVVTDGVGTGTVVLDKGELAEATVEARRMTLEQVQAAGIDPNAVENKTVFQLQISIPYSVSTGGGPLTIDAYQAGDQFLLPNWDDPTDPTQQNRCKTKGSDGKIQQIQCRGGGGGGGLLTITPTQKGGEPQLVMLALSGEASMMKEFFNVDMVVRNLSKSSLSRITGGMATLELGSGLVLAPTPTPQDLRRQVSDIAAGGDGTASWIVRGDEAGTTSVRASFRGTLAPFGAPVDVDTEPAAFQVYGAGAVQVVVQASPTQVKDRPFIVRMGLKNVTKDAVVYNATLSLKPEVDWVSPLPHEPVSRKDKILPGETWFAPDWQFLWGKDDATLDLSKLPANAIGRTAATGDVPPPVDGSTDVVEALSPQDDPAQTPVFLRQSPGADGAVTLDWDTVKGATSYQVLQSSPGTVGFTPVGAPVTSGTSVTVPVADVFPDVAAGVVRTKGRGMSMLAATSAPERTFVVASTVAGSSVIRHNQVHATPPYADTVVEDGNWRLKGEVNKTADGYLARGSVTLNGLVITPTGDGRLELNTKTRTLRSSGGVVLGLTLGGKTVDLGEIGAFTWPLTDSIALRVVDGVLLGLAVQQAAEGASNLTLSAPAPGTLAVAATLLPPPLVAAAAARATLLLDAAGAVTVQDAKIAWPDAVLGTLGRGSLELALKGSGAQWAVTGKTVAGGALTGDLEFDVSGALTAGSLNAEKVAPFGLVGLDSLGLSTKGGNSWTVSGSGAGGTVTGSLTTDDKGGLSSGSLTASRATVPGLTTFTGVTAALSGGTWTVGAQQPVLAGSLTVDKGRITAGSLTATDLPLAGVVTAKTLQLAYDAATSSYTASGSFDAPGRPGALTGTVKVVDGALVDTSLSGARLDLGPLSVTSPKVRYTAADESWQVSGATSTLGTLITVSSFRATRKGTPDGPSTLTLDGVTGAGAVSGSLTTDAAGAVTDGSVASTRLQVGLLDLPDFRIAKSGATWSGSTGTGPTSKQFSFGYDDTGKLTSGRLFAATLPVTGIGDISGFALDYARGTWTASSTAPVVSGSLTVTDGAVSGGSLKAADLPVLGLFTVRTLDLAYSAADASYRGRVSLDVPGRQDAATVDLVVKEGAVDSLALGLGDLPVVGLASAQGVRVAWNRSGSTTLTADRADIVGLVSIDAFTLERPGDGRPFHLSGNYAAAGASGRVEADLTLTEGRLSGGSVTFTGLSVGGLLPIGDVTLGYRDGGWVFGTESSPVFLDIRDGVLTAGKVSLPDVRLANAFSMGRVALSFTDQTWSGALDGLTPEFGMDLSFNYDATGLVKGQLKGALPLVPGWGVRGILASFDRATDSWSGAAKVDLPDGTIGGSIEIVGGKLKSIGLEGGSDVPVAAGVSLTGVKADLTLEPFTLDGTATFGLGAKLPTGKYLATATGGFRITADAAGNSSWRASAGVALGGLPLSAGATLGYEHPAGTATLAGTFSAGQPDLAYVTAALGATFTPAAGAFSATASGAVHVLGQKAQGTVTVTEKGYGGCASLEVLGKGQRGGFFQTWGGAREDMGVCDSAPFTPLSNAAAPQVGQLRTMSLRAMGAVAFAADPAPVVAAADGPTPFVLGAGNANVVLRFVGTDAPPTVVVRDPAQTATGTALVAPDTATTYVVLTAPAAGTWTYQVTDGQALSQPAAGSVPLPEPQVTAATPVVAKDGTATATWTLLPLPGQEVRFIEIAPDGASQLLSTTTQADGTLTFVPLPGDGTHVVTGQVLQGGLVRTQVEVASFVVGSGGPTPSPSPTETVSPGPSPTETVSPTPSPTETVSPGPVPGPTGPGPVVPGAGRTVTVPPGGTASSDAGTGPVDAADPVRVEVTVPDGGSLTLREGAPAPGGFRVLGSAFTVQAPVATVSRPLLLTVSLHSSQLPPGVLPADVTVLRDGQSAADCLGDGAVPDPCVQSRSFDGQVLRLVVRSAHASSWALTDDGVGRIAGPDRVATAVEVSRGEFPAGGAGAVVLARSDDFADALAGTPLAAKLGAPLLLTPTGALAPATAAELQRVLPRGGAVHLLGGAAAVSEAVDSAVRDLGFTVRRHAGSDRYATAVAVADALGSPSTVLLATGLDSADGLAAGVAASKAGGAVLLTAGRGLPPATADYLAAHPGEHLAVGGPAAAALPATPSVVGADRYATAALLAGRFFPAATGVGLASGVSFADSLAAGPQLARRGEPLLLSGTGALPAVTRSWLTDRGVQRVHLYGGVAALAPEVEKEVASAATPPRS